MAQNENEQLDLIDVQERPSRNGIVDVKLETNEGVIRCRLHPGNPDIHFAPGRVPGIVWVGGAGGGLEGPARGLYPRLSEKFAPQGITSLRLDYRHPNHLMECVLDTLMGVLYLQGQGVERVVLVGHSFGGAVVITAGANSEAVVGVATLSSQTYGTDEAVDLSPRSLLLLHGSSDRILPDWCSKDIYARAHQPKEIHLYPGCDHGLDECRQQVDQDLSNWIQQVLL